MSDSTIELSPPAAVCEECFASRRTLTLGDGSSPIVVCHCHHTSTCAFWTPFSGWTARSPMSAAAFNAVVDETVAAAQAQLAALRHVQLWAVDRCTHERNARVPLEELHRDYSMWAHVEDLGAAVSLADFAIALARSGAVIEQHAKGARCVGVRVRRLA